MRIWQCTTEGTERVIGRARQGRLQLLTLTSSILGGLVLQSQVNAVMNP